MLKVIYLDGGGTPELGEETGKSIEVVEAVKMIEPSTVWIVLLVSRQLWPLAVHQVKWIATEWIGGVEMIEDTRIHTFPLCLACKMVLPGLFGVEWS